MTTTYSPVYGTKGTVTVTLTSLANGSCRQSTAVDFAALTPAPLDVLIRVRTKGAAGGTAYLEVFFAATIDSASETYTDGATGSDAAFTAANLLNARPLGSVLLNAATAVEGAPMSIASAFGGVMPRKGALIFRNSSGAALSATAGDHVIEYEPINAQAA